MHSTDQYMQSQYYEEALELKQFAARMYRTHPEIKVLKLVVSPIMLSIIIYDAYTIYAINRQIVASLIKYSRDLSL